MNRNQTFKVLAVVFAISIILTVATAALESNSASKISGTSVSVLPAGLTWAKTYGAVGDDDRAYCALPVDNNYFVVGSSESNETDITVGWALMLDHEGNMLWNKTYLEGSGTELRFALNLTDGFLLVGNEFLPSGNMNGYVAKIDTQGNLIWNETLGNNGLDEFYSAFAVSNGFILLGLTSQNGGAQSQAWVVKIDTNGNVDWNRDFSIGDDTVAKTGVLADDGTYMVGGYADPRGPGDFSFLLMKIDTNGNLIWNQTYGDTGSEEATAMSKSSDGYIIIGNTQVEGGNMHAWIIKVDLDGSLLWAKTVGGEKADSPSCITPSGDGGYLIGGFTFSWGAGNRDFWLFKIDDSGNVLWSCTQGNAAYQEAYGVIPSGQNQYVMVGWTDPPNQPTLVGKARYLFYVVDITYPATKSNLTSPQLVFYGLVSLDVLSALLLVVFRLSQGRKKISPQTYVNEKEQKARFRLKFEVFTPLRYPFFR